MPIPKYYELYMPFLSAVIDGEVHTLKEIKSAVSSSLHLSEEDLSERISSGQTVFDNRLGWSRTYLKKAGLIASPQRAHFVITEEGQRLFNSGEIITDNLLAERYPDFAAFKGNQPHAGQSSNPAADIESSEETETPQETLERAYGLINDQLADDLLTEIMNQTPAFFENLVVDLMRGMGYGDGFVTKTSGDEGIDGIIHEDKLGFNLIYIQAKRWNPETTIGRPEIQKFAGAMMGPPKVENGLFITTAHFSDAAQKYADAQHIILVDGKKLCELMIEYGIGVSTVKSYKIKRLDSDYFSDN